MFDKRLRPSVEQKLRPVGANLRKSGIKADHLTLLGMLMAVGAAVAIANGAL
ncbi:MAG: CDP-diacylglycerol---glycerol-3-phosphate 3-phosphatidyltransferase, partial [Acidimicrobiaceae bacterium]